MAAIESMLKWFCSFDSQLADLLCRGEGSEKWGLIRRRGEVGARCVSYVEDERINIAERT